LDALGGSNETWGDQAAVTGVKDGFSFSLAQGHIQTQGSEPNGDFSQNAVDAFIQATPSARSSLQAEVNINNFSGGEFESPATPSAPSPVRGTDHADNFRIGGLFGLSSDSNLVFSGMYQSRVVTAATLDGFASSEADLEASTVEAQYYLSHNWFDLLAGVGHTEGSVTPKFFLNGNPFLQFSQITEYYTTAYVYGQMKDLQHRISIELGLSVDSLKQGFVGLQPIQPLERHEVNPKLGLVWNPYPATTLRAAAFKSVQRLLVANQTIEPTEIAGFNQFFDDEAGTIAWRYALGLDQRLVKGTHVGLEASQRDLKVAQPPPGSDQVVDYDWKERAGRVYLYWSLPRSAAGSLFSNWSWAANAEYQYEEFLRPPGLYTGFEGFAPLKTQFIPIGLTGFPGDYLSIRIATTYINQTGTLESSFLPGQVQVGGDFWVTDIGMVYRFPGRQGQLTLGVSNLFNEKLVGYQDADPANPRFTHGRFMFARLMLQFY
jgi:hypothetical protein